jgi:spore coat protein H
MKTPKMYRREFIQSLCASAAGAAIVPSTTAFSDLFKRDRLHEINIETDAADWALLRERYLTNDWYWCRMQWNGIDVKAAMRSRGNGSRNPGKPSLRVSFKRSADSGPFFGQDAIILGNMAQDSTLLKNSLAYDLFAKMGLPAPRTSYARLSINGQFWGIYLISEEIESPYLTDRLGEKDGHLYEYSWVDYYYFEERGEGRDVDYIPAPFELKNNSRNPNPAPLTGLIETINRAGDGEFWNELSAFIDPKQWLTYLAVETLIEDGDGLLGEWGMNGFYLYNYQRSTKFTVLPWDKDWSFFRWDRPPLENAQQNVLFRRLLATPQGRDLFRAELSRAATTAGGPGGWLETEARARQALTWKTALEDKNRVEGVGPIDQTQTRLLEFTQRRADFLRRWISDLNTSKFQPHRQL